MTRRNPTTRGEDLAIIAQLLANHARRYDDAARRIRDARGATRAGGAEPVSGSTEPTMPTLHADVQATEEDHHNLETAYKAAVNAERTIARILGRWAATPTGSISTWCESHQRLDINEPRSTDGSRNCDWCANVKRNYGTWPTKALAQLHAQGRRISDAEYRRLLGKGAA